MGWRVRSSFKRQGNGVSIYRTEKFRLATSLYGKHFTVPRVCIA